MIRILIADVPPEGIYERNQFEQLLRRVVSELEIMLGHAFLEVYPHPTNIHFNVKGPDVVIKYNMFGNHVQIQAVGKDEKAVQLVKEEIYKEVRKGLEAEVNY